MLQLQTKEVKLKSTNETTEMATELMHISCYNNKHFSRRLESFHRILLAEYLTNTLISWNYAKIMFCKFPFKEKERWT